MTGSIVGTTSVKYLVWYSIFAGPMSTFSSTLLFIYVTMSFGYLEFSLGLLLIVRRVLRKLKDIFDITLTMVHEVAADLKVSTQHPATNILLKKMMSDLIIPAIRAVLTTKLGV